MSEAINQFLNGLINRLKPQYVPPAVSGGHEFLHVERVVAIAESKVSAVVKFDRQELIAAAWLHNLDRCAAYENAIRQKDIGAVCETFLKNSPFSKAARARIIDAVIQHNKKHDGPNDSSLLTALRMADKIDRFSPSGILASAAFHGSRLLAYNPENPFGYGSTREKEIKTIYSDLFRILEWYGMLPSDEARHLIGKNQLRFFINFLRALGEEIAVHAKSENKVEEDIRKALGEFYNSVTAAIS